MFRLALSFTYQVDYKAGVWIDPEPGVSLDKLRESVMARLREAEAIRAINEKLEGGLSAFRSAFMEGIEKVEERVRDDTEDRHFAGLVGEIITEITTEQCLSITVLDINWRNGGHANRGGMDIVGVWNRDDSDYLVLIDSKFCGQTSTSPEVYARQRIEEAIDGIEDYQENELKMARSFVSIAGRMLKIPLNLQTATALLNLFEEKPRICAPSVIVCRESNAESIIKEPPQKVTTIELRVALALIDLKSYDFLTELMPDLGLKG